MLQEKRLHCTSALPRSDVVDGVGIDVDVDVDVDIGPVTSMVNNGNDNSNNVRRDHCQL